MASSALMYLSHSVNVGVTYVIGYRMLRRSVGVDKMPSGWSVYGPDSPARRILASVYLSIGTASLFAMIASGVPALGGYETTSDVAKVLFPMQILYKTLTPFTVGTLRNPVVSTNLGIVVLHSVTLGVVFGLPQVVQPPTEASH